MTLSEEWSDPTKVIKCGSCGKEVIPIRPPRQAVSPIFILLHGFGTVYLFSLIAWLLSKPVKCPLCGDNVGFADIYKHR